jgi:hypothetical protein
MEKKQVTSAPGTWIGLAFSGTVVSRVANCGPFARVPSAAEDIVSNLMSSAAR